MFEGRSDRSGRYRERADLAEERGVVPVDVVGDELAVPGPQHVAVREREAAPAGRDGALRTGQRPGVGARVDPLDDDRVAGLVGGDRRQTVVGSGDLERLTQ